MNIRKLLLCVALTCAICGQALAGYTYNASDFATEVVSYTEGLGAGKWTTSAVALGRPTVDTVGDGVPPNGLPPVPYPVIPFYPPLKETELVSIGYDGELIVKFDHRVENDPRNPFGIDLLIFGNSLSGLDSTNYYRYTDPTLTSVASNATNNYERGTVSVSQDGKNWYTFTTGPYADDFAPTLGRVYDPDNPESSLNSYAWTNNWWGHPTDPTLPLDPTLGFGSFRNKTVAQVAEMYGESAGGTGFDIGQLSLDWIQYVRVQNFYGSGFTPEVDAFADVAPVHAPEPATWMLLAAGLVGWAAKRRYVPRTR